MKLPFSALLRGAAAVLGLLATVSCGEERATGLDASAGALRIGSPDLAVCSTDETSQSRELVTSLGGGVSAAGSSISLLAGDRPPLRVRDRLLTLGRRRPRWSIGSGVLELLGAPVEGELDEGFASRSEEPERIGGRGLRNHVPHRFDRLVARRTLRFHHANEGAESLAQAVESIPFTALHSRQGSDHVLARLGNFGGG